MTHPLSPAAVEAAAAKLYAVACEQRGFKSDWEDVFSWAEFKENVMAGMNAAISAAFEQARAEGNVRDGQATQTTYLIDWHVTTQQDYEGDFSVTIIRKAKP